MTRTWSGLFLAFAIIVPGVVAAAVDQRLLSGLSARNIGIAATSGRISALDALVSDPNHIVAGAATGGVWISRNGGLNWEPVFDDQPVASIGAVAINQDNPDIIWVGTGESNVRNSTSIGGGVFKSVDGGKTWKLMGLANSERIDRIALHPTDPDVVWVAALGTLWGPNSERGIYKSTDGGASWRRVLYVDETTGGTDVKLDPANPHRVYAAMWQFRRWPYQFKSGGPGSGLYVSHDGGETWDRKTQEDGLPEGDLGRIVIAPSAADSRRVYALVEAKKSALLRSDDSGASWTAVNTEYNVADRPFYYSELFADPANPDRVYNVATRLRVSIDGGKNFEYVPGVDCCAHSNNIHIDNHAFWINPKNPEHIVLGNDGGLAVTRDRGATWRFVRNLVLTQFYHIAVDDDDPYHIYGGLQDNGSWRGPSEIRELAGIRNFHWNEVGFGDGFDVRPDPRNSRRGYSMSQGGFLYRWNLDSGDLRLIRPPPPTPETVLRFNWNAALAIDPFDPDTVYYGSQFVHKSSDRGASWSVISPDLTSNDPAKQTFRESGGITPDVTAAENYTSLVALAPSPIEAGVLWAGSDDGRIHVTRDGGQSWNRVDENARGVPAGAWVPMIHPSPHDASVAHVVFDDHRRSNMQPYVFRLENYGRRWRNLTTDDLSGYTLSVLQDPVDPQLLFVGTEFGLFFSTNAGGSWTRFRQGVPTVSVMDMAIQARENDLVLGTHGRGIFVIDDYSALRGLDASVLSQRFALLGASDGQQYDPVEPPSSRFTGDGEFRGANEPYGVMLTFVASGDDLKHPDDELERKRKADLRAATLAKSDASEDAAGDDEDDEKPKKLQMTVTDSEGQTVRKYQYEVHQGLNRITWDLSSDGTRPPPGPEPRKLDDGLPGGAEVPPGRYTATLEFDGITQSAEVQVLHDPRSEYSEADRVANFTTLKRLQGLRERAISVLENVEHARDDVATVSRLIEQRANPESDDEARKKALDDLKSTAKSVTKKLDELEKAIRVPPKTPGIVFDDDRVLNLVGLAQFYVGSTLGAPSPSAAASEQAAQRAVEDVETRWQGLVDAELKPLAEQVREAGLSLLVP